MGRELEITSSHADSAVEPWDDLIQASPFPVWLSKKQTKK